MATNRLFPIPAVKISSFLSNKDIAHVAQSSKEEKEFFKAMLLERGAEKLIQFIENASWLEATMLAQSNFGFMFKAVPVNKLDGTSEVMSPVQYCCYLQDPYSLKLFLNCTPQDKLDLFIAQKSQKEIKPFDIQPSIKIFDRFYRLCDGLTKGNEYQFKILLGDSAEIKPEDNTLYIRKNKEGTLSYTVKTPQGDIAENILLSELEAPVTLDEESLLPLQNFILQHASDNHHILLKATQGQMHDYWCQALGPMYANCIPLNFIKEIVQPEYPKTTRYNVDKPPQEVCVYDLRLPPSDRKWLLLNSILADLRAGKAGIGWIGSKGYAISERHTSNVAEDCNTIKNVYDARLEQIDQIFEEARHLTRKAQTRSAGPGPDSV